MDKMERKVEQSTVKEKVAKERSVCRGLAI